MKSLAILSLIIVGAFCSTFQDMLFKDVFQQWKQAHGKIYKSAQEEEYRFKTFLQNYKSILAYNAEQDDVTLGLNLFADLTSEEFSRRYTGTLPSKGQGEIKKYEAKDLPASFDWRTKGAVTPVKNQGSCGSCWTFSTTGALEGLYYINSSKLVSLSEQNLVDCVTEDFGCGGGWPIDAMTYAAQNGIETETDYPYAGVNQKCAHDASKAIVVNSGYYNVTPNDVDQLKAAIVGQPVSVCIQANQLVFQFYRGGVIKKLCGATIDHAVLAVGYDNIKGTDAFIVKNSWGGSWGAEGYVYISTDGSANSGKGVCGILSMAAIPYKN